MIEFLLKIRGRLLATREFGVSKFGKLRRNLKNTLLSKTIPYPVHGPTVVGQTLYLAGMFSTANGIGEAARSAYSALKSAGVKVIAVDISSAFGHVDFETDIPCIHHSNFPFRESGTLLLYMNGAEVIFCLNKLGLRKKYPWKVVGVWVWELPSFPQAWVQALPYVSEIWTYSHFSKQALDSYPTDMKVTVMPPPIFLPKTKSQNELNLDIPPNKFVILTMCDARSGIDRKNPIGAINAFKLAYQKKPNIFLIVKTRNFAENTSAFEEMRTATSNHQGILWIDNSISKSAIDEMFQRVDCFLSLHKSEGFGLTLAQAMIVGKPCIASAWSANLDYMDEKCALLVPYQSVPVDDRGLVYSSKETYWGEPDINIAAERIIEISTDKALYETISKQGRLKIMNYCDPRKLGERMIALLSASPSY